MIFLRVQGSFSFIDLPRLMEITFSPIICSGSMVDGIISGLLLEILPLVKFFEVSKLIATGSSIF